MEPTCRLINPPSVTVRKTRATTSRKHRVERRCRREDFPTHERSSSEASLAPSSCASLTPGILTLEDSTRKAKYSTLCVSAANCEASCSTRFSRDRCSASICFPSMHMIFLPFLSCRVTGYEDASQTDY